MLYNEEKLKGVAYNVKQYVADSTRRDARYSFARKRHQQSIMIAYDREGKYNTEQLHTYFQIENAPSVWHIHGEAARHGTMILGHYYYGKLLSKMQQYVSSLIARHGASTSRGQDMEARS